MHELYYRVSFGQDHGRVEVAIFDPQRWIKSAPENPGGSKFGFEAEAYVSEDRTGDWAREDRPLVAEVSQAAIGTHSVEDAEQRIFVYTQALRIATWINNWIAAGRTLEYIDHTLQGLLTPGKPTTIHLGADGFWTGKPS